MMSFQRLKKRWMMKKMGMLVVAMSLAIGCSGRSGDENRATQLRDQEKLQTRYTAVQGLYVGTITPAQRRAAPVRVELGLYIDQRFSSIDVNGNTVFRPVLLGRFVLPDVISENDREDLMVDYDDVTGQLVMGRAGGASGAQGAAAGGANSPFSIRGRFSGDEITATVIRTGGVWGQLNIKRVSTTVSSSPEGEDRAEQDRRTKILETVVGRYVGLVKGGARGSESELILSIAQVEMLGPSGAMVPMPTLVARFRDINDQYEITTRFLPRVTFNSQDGSIFATNAQSVTGAQATLPASILTASGFVKNGEATVELSNGLGPLGRFTGRRQSN